MGTNLGIGTLVGASSLWTTSFDIAWKANRRNYRLLRRHLDELRQHTWRDWVFLLLVTLLGLVFALPIFLVVWFVTWLIGH
jgi:hypothetical protein